MNPSSQHGSLGATKPDGHRQQILLWVWTADLLLHELEEGNSVLSKAEETPFAVSWLRPGLAQC